MRGKYWITALAPMLLLALAGCPDKSGGSTAGERARQTRHSAAR